jgi:tRNA U38,U39,U40 pseudouridine synthase TruA
VREVLEAKNRKEAGKTAPPNGLYLMKVNYHPQINFPHSSLSAWFL